MSEKFPGVKPNDTFWDNHHRSRGMMTNHEFFSSNAKGGFYEGMEWDESSRQWVPDAAARQKEWELEEKKRNTPCDFCGEIHSGTCY